MKVAGLIAEYNPFHFGHKLHLENAKTVANASHTIAVMSGSFVQRGEPALVDKWTRAEMAVKNGVDLVIELPFAYSVQTAELFAAGATKILDSTGAVDCIVFGSESGEIEELMRIAEVLVEEPPFFKVKLKEYLDEGNSFSSSRSLALSDYAQTKGINLGNSIETIKESNNILGIEYLKSLIKMDSLMEPYTIKRIGDRYKDSDIKSKIASATGIRQSIKKSGLGSVVDYLPVESYAAIERFIENYGNINQLDNYSAILNYILCISTPENITDYFDVEIGLENRIKNLSKTIFRPTELVTSAATKRYAETRIQRLLIHMIAGLKKDSIHDFFSHNTMYVRILASNSKGFQIINRIKEKSEIHIINKVTDSMALLNKKEKSMLEMDMLATDLYFLGLHTVNPQLGLDYLNSPYIMRND
ncbi:MAG: nucleotidyltransferase [Bacillota bacterium]